MRESIALIEHSRQKLEKSLREKREKLMSLQHNRDFKMGLELQLSELQELMKTHKAECEVSIFFSVLSLLTFSV